MPKHQIRLAHYNSSRFIASVSDKDNNDCDLCTGADSLAVCRAAARKLRELAGRFDLLARESREDHCRATTHDKINRVPASRQRIF